MKLFNDKELAALLTKSPSIIQNHSRLGDPYSENSPVQPASLDLQVGTILIPGEQENVALGSVVEHTEYCVPPGGTVVVVTKEVLRLDSTVAGIVFPASSVGFRGIVITNPGHIDPGYEGPLRFTLVNVGKEPYALRSNCVLVTLLLFEINRCAKNWSERRSAGRGSNKPGLKDIQPLSRDFLDVDKRAEGKAQTLLDKWDKRNAIVVGALGVVAALLGAWISSYFSNQWRDELRPVKADIDALKSQAIFNSLTDRLYKVEQKLAVVASASANSPLLPRPNVGQPASIVTSTNTNLQIIK